MIFMILLSSVAPVLAYINPMLEGMEESYQETYYEQWAAQADFEAEIELRVKDEFEYRLQIASITILMDAAREGTSADIRKLIKDGEYIHAKDYYGNTALIYAVEKNTPEVVQALIDAGAYVSRFFLLNFWDEEYLRDYRSIKYPEVIGVMVKAGADVNARDDEGKTVLIKAVYVSSHHISVDVISALIEAGADVNAKDKDAKTALIYCAENVGKSIAILKALIKAGASINSRDKYGKTALMYVAEIGNDYAVNVLLNASADINIEDNSGNTALYYAKSSKKLSNYTLKRLGASWYELHWW